ncbi:DNA-binding FadR family transcriptional regulator [Streptomyces sp. BK208]|uniref:FadR/GntR family transcriptional regulator n=1 Tax=Streptomyces sp. BK208 TaxID=2512150 RepID=UPI001061EDE6|nr:FadR/GntR family transcriptional regulator [Streptomyces sp. BK208]TDT27554.1 DNA-binding FadR family transcriptional regulator [Streptomyces sp. BK208]
MRSVAADAEERIKELIVEQGLGPGDPLPTETELMERFGVSRNSLREALKSLQAMHIVEIRRGFGTYVGTMSLEPMTEAMAFRTVVGHRRGRGSLLELLQLREALEAGLMHRLAGRLPEGDLTELDALVETMHREVRETGEIAAGTDRAFHRVLHRSLDNDLLSEVLDAFWSAFHRVRAQARDIGSAADGAELARMHARIVDAVRAGDAEAAETAVHRHFDDIRGRLSQH